MDDSDDLYEQAPCPYVVLQMDGTFARVNQAFVALSGISVEIALSTRFQKLLTTAGAIFYETQILPTLHLYGTRKEVALDIVQASGQRVPVLANFSLRQVQDHLPSGILVVILEASERRLYERDLLQSRRNAEQIAEVVLHSTDAIITLSLSNAIESWNDGAEKMFGYSAKEAIGRTFVELIFRKDNQQDLAEARVFLERGKVFTKELVACHKENRTISVSVTLTPHMEAPGVLVAYSAIIRDDTSRRLAERALLQSEKLAAVGRLASSIAHEINNPLASVTNLIFLARQGAVNEEQQAYLDSADEELRRVSVIATQTLRFHHQLSKPQEISCTNLFNTLVGVYQSRLRNSAIVVERRERGDRRVVCFEGEIRQVLSNLFTNAIDSMSKGGRLLLRSHEGTFWKTGQRGLYVTVADSGSGMSLSTKAHLFEAFFTTKGIGGTGLGLWISSNIMERHKGSITLRSSQDEAHRGTVAVMFLPYSA